MKEFLPEIKEMTAVLKKGGVIVYPTDTIWGIGCDATSPEAIRKIVEIKKRGEEKNFIVLLDSEARLHTYVSQIPEQAWSLIEYAEKPLTIIFDGARNLPDELIAEDGSIAIRVTKDEFCKYLIGAMNKPIVSTSANISGQPSPASFREISPDILNAADHVAKWRREEEKMPNAPSTIIRLRLNGQIEFIRR
jgi:L-threonylcarbamoyladenylate synthase